MWEILHNLSAGEDVLCEQMCQIVVGEETENHSIRTAKRTWDEVLESPKYGRLFRIKRIHGNMIRAQRMGIRKGYLCALNEYLTLERTPQSKLSPVPGDFCFIDNGSKTWSLWKVEREVTDGK